MPLAACHTRQQMLDALLFVLRQEGAPNFSKPFDQVLQALACRRVLLVLDNFEQLVEAGRADLAQWLSALPGLQLLVTSRRALGLDGEAEHSLAALPLPPQDASLQAHALNPAVTLFADRARAVRADFHLSARNHQQVADIVRGLHGLPLAIELAAARVRSLGLADLQAMLQDPARSGGSLQLLSRSGPRAADDARHASMLYVLQWSWQQLSPAEQTLLALLSSCDGGASLAMLAHLQQACEDTRAGLTQLALSVDELLASSVAYRSESAAGHSRYHAFEAMREFVFHQAGADGVTRLRAQHARAVAAWAATLGHEPDLALARAEWPNLLRALAQGAEPAAKPADAEQAIHTVLAARWVLDDMSLPASALDHLRAAAALAHAHAHPLPHPHPHPDALLQSLLAMHSFHAGQREAAQQHAQAALACTPDSAVQRAEVLRNAAQVLVRLSSEPGPLLGLVQECLALAREHGLPDIEARALTLLGLIEYRAHREASAVLHHYQQALALWRRHGPRARAASGMASLAIQLGALHRVPEQLLLLGEARALAAQWGQQRLLAYCMSVTGYALTDLRRYAEAADMFGQCLQMDWDHAHWREWFYVLWNLPRTLAHLRQPQVAAQLMGFAENFYAQRFGVLGPEDLPEARRTRRLVAAQAGRAQAQAWWQEGAALSMAQAMALAQKAIGRD